MTPARPVVAYPAKKRRAATRSFPVRAFRYLWAAPTSAVGMALAGIACMLGASARIERGVLEVAGGKLASASVGPLRCRFVAITFGHVVLGVNHATLAQMRTHEHAHVRQYERYGILFFPLYLASSAAQLVRGRDPYWHNAFERQARDAASASSA